MAKLGLTAALKQCRGYAMPDNYFKGVDHDATYIHEQLSRLPVGMRQPRLVCTLSTTLRKNGPRLTTGFVSWLISTKQRNAAKLAGSGK